jgi:hypothetical protein
LDNSTLVKDLKVTNSMVFTELYVWLQTGGLGVRRHVHSQHSNNSISRSIDQFSFVTGDTALFFGPRGIHPIDSSAGGV